MQQVPLNDETAMKEVNIFAERRPPIGYILNSEAISEMNRIAEAGHLNPNFTISHRSVHGYRQNSPGYSVPLGPMLGQNLPPNTSLNSVGSSSQGSFGLGSAHSFDSNRSHGSDPTLAMHR